MLLDFLKKRFEDERRYGEVSEGLILIVKEEDN